MSKHMLRDFENLRRDIHALGGLVEEAANKAIVSLVDRRTELAEGVIEGDDRIDQKELEVDEECLKVLALHQPVAADLRYIVALMKVNGVLESIGDKAVHIAKECVFLSQRDPLPASLDLSAMAERVRAMVRMSLDSLLSQDAELAREVISRDDEVDNMKRGMNGAIMALMQRDPATIERGLRTLNVVRHLERIADLALHIAQDVVFMVEGEVIRHDVLT